MGVSVSAAGCPGGQDRLEFGDTFVQRRGGFLDLLGYLRELEKLPVKIYWDKLDLTVLDYPVSQMTLVVNTIGLDPAWMKI